MNIWGKNKKDKNESWFLLASLDKMSKRKMSPVGTGQLNIHINKIKFLVGLEKNLMSSKGRSQITENKTQALNT